VEDPNRSIKSNKNVIDDLTGPSHGNASKIFDYRARAMT